MSDSDPDRDQELLRLMIAGDESGFLGIYRKHRLAVERFCLRLSGSRHLAEEVTQETFLALIRAPQNYDSARGSLMLYLFGIARHLIWKEVRKEQLFSGLKDHEEDLREFAVVQNDPSREEELSRMRRALLTLPKKYREAVVLCALQELSYEEAASVAQCSVGTVRSRVHRAKQILIRKLSEPKATKSVVSKEYSWEL